jgi:DNA repair protein RadC
LQVKEIPVSEKPITKLRYLGADRLSNSELLLLLSGAKDTEVGDELIKEYGGILNLRGATLHELEHINGIGEMTAGKIVAAIELGRRLAVEPKPHRHKIGVPEDIANIFMEELRYLPSERMCLLLLNTKNEAINKIVLSIGNVNSSIVDPREVYSHAVKHGAASIILVHNHPSGNPEPSDPDIQVTKRLIQCGDMMDIKVLDHIIIGDGVFKSFKRERCVDFDSHNYSSNLLSEQNKKAPDLER